MKLFELIFLLALAAMGSGGSAGRYGSGGGGAGDGDALHHEAASRQRGTFFILILLNAYRNKTL